MILTVAIPTYKREELLAGSLQTLADQTIDREKYKLLIVDNAGREETRRIAEDFGAHYVVEEQVGLQHARNCAMEAADTPWVVFLDDDIRAPSELIEKFYNRLAVADYAVLGGKYFHWFLTPPAPWLYRYYTRAEAPSRRSDFGEVATDEYLFGGIMAVRKDAWREVGGFLPGLSMVGNKIGRAGEDEFQQRLRSAGYRLFYDPDIAFDHLVQPYKCSFRGQFSLAFASGRDGVGIRGQRKLNAVTILPHLARITFYSLPFNLARLLFKPGYFWQNAYVDTVTKYYFAAGQYLSANES
jgi:glycosyltransferase involved in cell wall biosynthesis